MTGRGRARFLFEEFAAPKREMMRKVLEREGTGGRMSEPDAETTAVVIPWMIRGVALGLHAFRGIDPSEISYEQVGRVVAAVIVSGVGGVGGDIDIVKPSPSRYRYDTVTVFAMPCA